MINKFFLGNFKAFGRTQEIPIKPLTLIFGPNSSGKSSIIQGLLLWSEMISKKSLDVTKIDTGQEIIDVGEFEQYVHGQEEGKTVVFGGSWTISKKELQSESLGFLKPFVNEDSPHGIDATIKLEIGINKNHDPGETEHLKLIAFRLCFRNVVEFEMVYVGAGNPEGMRIKRLELHHSRFNNLEELATQSKLMNGISDSPNADTIAESESTIEFFKKHYCWDDGDIWLFKQLPGFGKWSNDAFGDSGHLVNFDGQFVQSNLNKEKVSNAGLNLEHLNYLAGFIENCFGYAINNAVAGLQETKYLGPLRKFPKRFTQQSGRIPHGSQRTRQTDVWQQIADDVLLQKALSSWLGDERLKTQYELTTEPTVNPSGVTIDTLVLKDKQNNAVVGNEDVGTGISQIVPVLAVAMAGGEGTLIGIEQPELHLHPCLQADVMDVFIRAATGGERSAANDWREIINLPGEAPLDANFADIYDDADTGRNPAREKMAKMLREGTYPWHGPNFILETHSEALILRLMKRMRQTANGTLPEGMPGVMPKNVAILYVEPHDGGSVVHELELAEDGTLLDPWPGGFFEESFEERFGE